VQLKISVLFCQMLETSTDVEQMKKVEGIHKWRHTPNDIT
jgi:hypothetical protein